jgi:CheY-specific phosphatase CheX
MTKGIGDHPFFLAAVGDRFGLETLLEATIREVLGVYRLEVDSVPKHQSPGARCSRAEIIVVSGFTGHVQGILSLNCSTELAFEIAAKRMGVEVQDFDSRVREMLEGLGEAVANHFRGKLQNMGWTCAFSPPAVISGSEYHFHSTRRSHYVACSVTLEGRPIGVTLGLRPPQEQGILA